jgi:hypothetical protein
MAVMILLLASIIITYIPFHPSIWNYLWSHPRTIVQTAAALSHTISSPPSTLAIESNCAETRCSRSPPYLQHKQQAMQLSKQLCQLCLSAVPTDPTACCIAMSRSHSTPPYLLFLIFHLSTLRILLTTVASGAPEFSELYATAQVH